MPRAWKDVIMNKISLCLSLALLILCVPPAQAQFNGLNSDHKYEAPAVVVNPPNASCDGLPSCIQTGTDNPSKNDYRTITTTDSYSCEAETLIVRHRISLQNSRIVSGDGGLFLNSEKLSIPDSLQSTLDHNHYSPLALRFHCMDKFVLIVTRDEAGMRSRYILWLQDRKVYPASDEDILRLVGP